MYSDSGVTSKKLFYFLRNGETFVWTNYCAIFCSSSKKGIGYNIKSSSELYEVISDLLSSIFYYFSYRIGNEPPSLSRRDSGKFFDIYFIL